MKLSELIQELKILGVTEESDLKVALTMGRSGKLKDIHIVVMPTKKAKSKLALN